MRSSTIAIVASVLVLSSGSSSLATSIFAVRTPAMIVIGADSKAGTQTAPGSIPNRCKIGEANKVVWAVAGTTENTTLQISVHTEARTSMSKSDGFFARLKDFRQAVGRKLGNIFATMNKFEKDNFLKYMLGRRITEIIVATADRGEMRLAVLKYYSKREDETRIFSDQIIYPANGTRRDEINWEEIGTTNIRQTGFIDDPELLTRGAEVAVRRLLEVAIEKHPATVGPPISLVRIENDRVDWREKGSCLE